MGRPRIEIDISAGPTSVKHGFTQAAIELSITNRHMSQSMNVDDLRLMFSKDYGAPVLREAPTARTHPILPAMIGPQSTELWYFHAEDLSRLLANLYRPAKPIKRREVLLHVQCTLGTRKVSRGPWFMFTTDQQAHFPAPTKLRSISNIERLYKKVQAKWKYVVFVTGVGVVVWRVLSMFGISLF